MPGLKLIVCVPCLQDFLMQVSTNRVPKAFKGRSTLVTVSPTPLHIRSQQSARTIEPSCCP